MSGTVAVDDLRCPACGGEVAPRPGDPAAGLDCGSCGERYDTVWGVPFLGAYEEDDILGLIEIAANIANRGLFGVTPAVVEDWERLLAAYHEAPDKAAFVRDTPAAQSPYLANRYGEWSEIAMLTRDLELASRKVLDIGAGLGFDSHRLALRGATVTALEYSPLLAESGRANFPHIRWIGGFSHCLPFKSASFDAVFCNAALHHMRDIPAAMSEALRVLRPGGVLVTTCDSFRPSTAGDETELEIFDRVPAALLGVNEQVPRFSDFTDLLRQHAGLLDVELYTHTVEGPTFDAAITSLTRWSLRDDARRLANCSGSLALRVRLKERWTAAPRMQARTVLKPSQYATWLDSATSAVARLAPLMPDKYVDLPFPGIRGSKFELLNGWRLAVPGKTSRTAYHRGRWFLRRPAGVDRLSFEVGLPEADPAGEDIAEIFLDGRSCGERAIGRGAFESVDIDLSSVPPGQVFVVEIRRKRAGDSLDDGTLEVRGRHYGFATRRAHATSSEPGATVFAVIPVFNRLRFTRACIEGLKGQTHQPLRIVVSDGGSSDGTAEAIRAEHPDVAVLTSRTELWWTGAMAAGIDFALRESTGADDCVLMMNNDTQIPPDYVATLLRASRESGAAVGALIVDSRDPGRVLDAGEYVDWATYSFPVRDRVDPGERLRDDVDVLPGRGSLVPLRMIREAGNVDADLLPHYLADYEFFTRLKRHGFALAVCYETRLLAHIEETGIVPGERRGGFREIWNERFSRRSMSNVVDHWRFVRRHAPPGRRLAIRLRLAWGVFADLALRTPARPLFLPLFWLLALPRKVLDIVPGQRRVFAQFARDRERHGADVLCRPERIPRLIRGPVYLFACPGPVSREECVALGLSPDALVAAGVLRNLGGGHWLAFETVEPRGPGDPAALRLLLRRACRPWRKMARPLTWPSPWRKGAHE